MPKVDLTAVRQEIARRPHRRPYGARLSVELGDSVQILADGECSLIVNMPASVRLDPKLIQPSQFPHQIIDSTIEGYPTAGEAEQEGLRLARGWLWAAISLKCPLRLVYRTPLPCAVYDRTRGGGISLSATAHVLARNGTNVLAELLEEGMAARDPHDRLLLAMELFAAARLEATDRARFVGIVSALEPLAAPQSLGETVDAFVAQVQQLLMSTDGIDSDARTSLKGRVEHLRRESIARSLKRLLGETLPSEPIAREVLTVGYDVRSELLHTGRTLRDLRDWLPAVEDSMRLLFGAIVGMPLRTPASVTMPVG